jgi:hypothetical protein
MKMAVVAPCSLVEVYRRFRCNLLPPSSGRSPLAGFLEYPLLRGFPRLNPVNFLCFLHRRALHNSLFNTAHSRIMLFYLVFRYI